tara:strand:- start:241 stop:501 length:261 start_codon:yes stop_codon:yes gene_type:complete
MPKVGDLLIVTPKSKYHTYTVAGDGHEYTGIVYKIEHDKYCHPHKVHVQWSGDTPPNYNHDHGYAGTNIHNMRSEFKVIRDGIDIP